jgi:hypothetical protein
MLRKTNGIWATIKMHLIEKKEQLKFVNSRIIPAPTGGCIPAAELHKNGRPAWRRPEPSLAYGEADGLPALPCRVAAGCSWSGKLKIPEFSFFLRNEPNED